MLIICVGLFVGCGLTLVRACITEAVAYYLHEHIKMATAVAGLGFSDGFLLLPTPSGYLLMTLGFHKTMFILAPTMAIHLFGAVLYTKNEQHASETAEKPPDKEPLKATLLAMAANPKVNFYNLLVPTPYAK